MNAEERPEDASRRSAELVRQYEKLVNSIRDVHAIQGASGNWNRSPYMRGLYNGLELALAIMEGRDPKYREPLEIDQYLCNLPDPVESRHQYDDSLPIERTTSERGE